MTDTPPAPTPSEWVRSWIYLFAFLVWTVGVAVICMPMLLSRRLTLRVVRTWIRGIMFLARIIAGIDCRAEGHEHIPPGPCIIAAQHQSSFETYRLFLDMPHPIFILKQELIWIPVIGWYMTRAGFISIDRGAGAGAMRKMLRRTQAALDAGYQVVVFPEGTRSQPGSKNRYKGGGALLAVETGTPVVPVALNSGDYPLARTFSDGGLVRRKFPCQCGET